MRMFVLHLRAWLALLLALELPLLCYAAEDEDEFGEPAVQAARFYRNPEERREAGLGRQLTDWLLFSGLLEIEKEYLENKFKNNITTTEDDGAVPTIEAVFELTIFPWLVGEFVFEAEYDTGYFARADEILIAIESETWGLKIGRQNLPFGEYYSHFVSGPLLEFGETRATSLIADHSFNDNFEVSAFVFDSDFGEPSGNDNYDWGLAVEYVSSNEAIRFGASYLSDLAETDERLLEEHIYTYKKRVSAWSAYALIGFDSFELTAEIVQARRTLTHFETPATEVEQDEESEDGEVEEVTGFKPTSYNLELAYFPQPHLQFAVRVEHSDELEDEPEWRYGVSATWRIGKYVGVSLDYLYGDYKNDFVLDDNDNALDHSHQVAVQVVVEF
ncbi:MAG: LbtU family siderophore porin [Pseudomonadales bacterium]